MPLYEVMLIGASSPEVRLTDQALTVGDVVRIANQTYVVERTISSGRDDAELRYILVLEGTPAARAESRQTRSPAKERKTEAVETREKSKRLRAAAERIKEEPDS